MPQLGPATESFLRSIGLLILRIGAGGMMVYGHGWPKLANFGEISQKFADPLGTGPTLALALTVGAEFFCSLIVVLGLATRLAAIPPAITMFIAGFMIHAADPWVKKELAFLYLVMFMTLVFTGPGRLSLDAVVWKRKPPTPPSA